MNTTKSKNLRAILKSARKHDVTGRAMAARAKRAAAGREEVARANLAAAKRIAKVSTREVAKAGSHAVLILPDAHFPFNDERATDLVVKIAELVRPARIVSLGDTIEAAAWTCHAPRSIAEEATHRFSLEIEQAGAWIDRVRRASGGVASWAYLEGNHEAHVERECLRLGSVGRAVADLVSPRNLLTRGRPWMSWTPYVEPAVKGRRHRVAVVWVYRITSSAVTFGRCTAGAQPRTLRRGTLTLLSRIPWSWATATVFSL